MSKSILIIDTPENCTDCKFSEYQGIVCRAIGLNKSHSNPQKPDWCPLKELPEKKRYEPLSEGNPVKAWSNGWNACLDEILS